jgi:hypothetical protein
MVRADGAARRVGPEEKERLGLALGLDLDCMIRSSSDISRPLDMVAGRVRANRLYDGGGENEGAAAVMRRRRRRRRRVQWMRAGASGFIPLCRSFFFLLLSISISIPNIYIYIPNNKGAKVSDFVNTFSWTVLLSHLLA